MNPDWEVPKEGQHIWEWYEDITSGITRIVNGVPTRIPPSEYLAWASITGNLVHPEEFAILKAMDASWCDAMAVEIAEARARAEADKDEAT